MLRNNPNVRAAIVALIAAILAALATQEAVKGAEPETRVVVPLRQTATAAPASCVRMRHGSSACSATCIAQEGESSLVLTCNHCFADAPSRDGVYPQSCTVLTLDGRTEYSATAVVGRAAPDMSLLVVRGKIAPADLDGRLPEVGSTVEHWGICSTHTRGVVRALPKWGSYAPTDLFRSSCRSCPGDSGAGMFQGGKLVAVNWGYWSGGDQAGTPIAFVGGLVRESSAVRKAFPKFAQGFPEGIPPTIPPTIPPVNPPDICPPGGCRPPAARPLLFPRLLPRSRGR